MGKIPVVGQIPVSSPEFLHLVPDNRSEEQVLDMVFTCLEVVFCR